MHDTAMATGRLFFESYLANRENVTIVDIGAQDVTGSLRTVAPPNVRYIGVDFVEGKGVDVILTDPYSLPFESDSIDAIVCSSVLEHSEFFWLLFLEMIRILKPSGLLYVNVPSNGEFHRYPVDCWRFYPDSGIALARWAQRNGYKTVVMESFIGKQGVDSWSDFVCVFLKHEDFARQFPNRIHERAAGYTNGFTYGTDRPTLNISNIPEDQSHLFYRLKRKKRRWMS